MEWSPSQYSKFARERNLPVRDLMNSCPSEGIAAVADLGCGAGSSTALLAERYASASIRGIDSSQAMIDAAKSNLPSLAFELADIAAWRPHRKFDLVFANASLQWVPNHSTLLPRLLEVLQPGGTLAVQMPQTEDEPAHRLMRELARNDAWRSKLANVEDRQAHRHAAAWYHTLLKPLSASVSVWQTTYFHDLTEGAQGIVEWFKGTALRPYLGQLDEPGQTRFLSDYTAAVAEAYPADSTGAVLLPFPRLFFVAQVSGRPSRTK